MPNEPRKRNRYLMGGPTRDAYGVTVSASRDDGRRATFWEGGTPEQALRKIVFQIDHLPGRWYIEAISTPQTVYDDLRQRGNLRGGDHRWLRERQWLGRIKRLDLLRVPAVKPKASGKPNGWAWRDSASTYRRKVKFRKENAEGGDAP